MRLVDFLVLLLEAHSETLKRLAAFFGEERFLEMLESLEEQVNPALSPAATCFSAINGSLNGPRSPYQELEGAVREMALPEVLEFHLWAYPYYRAYIESDMDLGSALKGADEGAQIAIVDDAIRYAREWVHQLPIPPAISQQAEAAAGVPWIRFRTSTLKKMGMRPMGPVV